MAEGTRFLHGAHRPVSRYRIQARHHHDVHDRKRLLAPETAVQGTRNGRAEIRRRLSWRAEGLPARLPAGRGGLDRARRPGASRRISSDGAGDHHRAPGRRAHLHLGSVQRGGKQQPFRNLPALSEGAVFARPGDRSDPAADGGHLGRRERGSQGSDPVPRRPRRFPLLRTVPRYGRARRTAAPDHRKAGHLHRMAQPMPRQRRRGDLSALLRAADRLLVLGVRRGEIPDLRAVGIALEAGGGRQTRHRRFQMAARSAAPERTSVRSEGNRYHQAFLGACGRGIRGGTNTRKERIWRPRPSPENVRGETTPRFSGGISRPDRKRAAWREASGSFCRST